MIPSVKLSHVVHEQLILRSTRSLATRYREELAEVQALVHSFYSQSELHDQ